MRKPLIVAHRGDAVAAPDSSLPAFAAAIVQGADAIEFDVHSTRDGELVVHHDYYLGKTENAAGPIGDYTLAELKRLDVGSAFDPRFAGERMPGLQDVLDLGRKRVRFEVEVRTPSLAALAKAVEQMRSAGVAADVEITSPHVPLLPHARALCPELRVGMFFGPFPAWMQRPLWQQHVAGWMALAGAQVAHLDRSLLQPEAVDWLHEQGLFVHGANLNAESEIRSALELGLDQFSTDRLGLALCILGAGQKISMKES